MPEVTPKAYAQLLSISWQKDDLPLWSLKIRDGYQRRLGFSEMSNAKKDPSLITIMLVGKKILLTVLKNIVRVYFFLKLHE